MRHANLIFCAAFVTLLLAMGAIDAVHHVLAMAADPRRMDYESPPENQGIGHGPWHGNVHIVRKTYGDISKSSLLIPFRHEVVETLSTDPYGFRNPGYREGDKFDAVILGDCFTEGSDGPLFHRYLEQASGLRVYNYNRKRPRDFFADSRFLSAPPKFLIVERIERGFTAEHFQGFMNPKPLPEESLHAGQRIISRLRKCGDVLSHSFFLDALQWQFSTLRYRLENRLPCSSPLMVPKLGMLFFHEEVSQHGLTVAERGLAEALDSLSALDRACRARGIRLVVMMIPDKYTVYGGKSTGREVVRDLGDILRPALDSGLSERGIAFVDIFPTFKSHAGLADTLLYELDDTRWTAYGKRLAAIEFSQQVHFAASDAPDSGGAQQVMATPGHTPSGTPRACPLPALRTQRAAEGGR